MTTGPSDSAKLTSATGQGQLSITFADGSTADIDVQLSNFSPSPGLNASTETKCKLRLFYGALAIFLIGLTLLAFKQNVDLVVKIVSLVGLISLSRTFVDALQKTNEWSELSAKEKTRIADISLGMNVVGAAIAIAGGFLA